MGNVVFSGNFLGEDRIKNFRQAWVRKGELVSGVSANFRVLAGGIYAEIEDDRN